jgi:hypothetical protein
LIKEVADKIIELLKSDQELNFDWYFEPPVRAKTFPYGFVDFAGGPVEEGMMGTKSIFRCSYYVVMVHRRRSDTDNTERSLMDWTEKAMDILRENYTLGGLVLETVVTAVEGDFMPTDQGNLIATRITLQVKLWL